MIANNFPQSGGQGGVNKYLSTRVEKLDIPVSTVTDLVLSDTKYTDNCFNEGSYKATITFSNSGAGTNWANVSDGDIATSCYNNYSYSCSVYIKFSKPVKLSKFKVKASSALTIGYGSASASTISKTINLTTAATTSLTEVEIDVGGYYDYYLLSFPAYCYIYELQVSEYFVPQYGKRTAIINVDAPITSLEKGTILNLDVEELLLEQPGYYEEEKVEGNFRATLAGASYWGMPNKYGVWNVTYAGEYSASYGSQSGLWGYDESYYAAATTCYNAAYVDPLPQEEYYTVFQPSGMSLSCSNAITPSTYLRRADTGKWTTSYGNFSSTSGTKTVTFSDFGDVWFTGYGMYVYSTTAGISYSNLNLTGTTKIRKIYPNGKHLRVFEGCYINVNGMGNKSVTRAIKGGSKITVCWNGSSWDVVNLVPDFTPLSFTVTGTSTTRLFAHAKAITVFLDGSTTGDDNHYILYPDGKAIMTSQGSSKQCRFSLIYQSHIFQNILRINQARHLEILLQLQE